MKEVRCAIYTRKSSEEGLEQDFNSLHAQRDACAAYVLSQASEGWTLLGREYDDGGISGGTLERPALKQLLADISAGKIDIVVVYKVDRLTRSLLDFAKLVEAFDMAGTSFVSITQSFNTTTSMGRLTLNMLLSFAQFEREVTAERIRDKLAASKAKGMWMGGTPPLGYRGDGRSLAIVEEHAALVRDIYARYRDLGNVREVANQLADANITVPCRTAGTGRKFGGKPFTRGQLYALLKNPVYAGDIPHRDKVYPGNHAPIIERPVWDQVQGLLAGHIKGTRGVRVPKSASALAGRIFDEAGEPLLAAHTNKRGQRYRYYVSKALHLGNITSNQGGIRLPAREIEQLAASELAGLFAKPIELIALAGLAPHPAELTAMAARCAELAAELRGGEPDLARWLERVVVYESRVQLVISADGLGAALAVPLASDAPPSFVRTVEGRLTRTGLAVRLVQDNGEHVLGASINANLLRLLVKARHWWDVLAQGELTPTELAAREGVTRSYLVRVARLAFLSPQVVEGILAGKLRSGIDAAALLKPAAISLDWQSQEKRLLAG